MDFSYFHEISIILKINHGPLYKWTMHEKSPSSTANPNNVQNHSTFIELVLRTQLARAILMT